MGTTWAVDTADPLTPDECRAVADLIEEADRTWSRFREDGAVARLRTGQGVDLGADAADLLDLYDRLDAATDGAVNPLVGGSLETLGYDAAYSLRPHGRPEPAPRWAAAEWDGSRLRVPAGAVLDVGAAGKGWLADRVADLLAARGHAPTVDASGDIAHRGPMPLRIALEHPGDPTLAVGVVTLPSGRALCGSAVNRRAWGDGLHHVLDARTGAPARGVVAAWAVADSAAVADGCATALFFTPPERLAEFGIDAVWIDADGLHSTPGCPVEVFA
ncbi:MAG: FAD:protein FMN transferase [Aeromicrobium sp.]